MLDPGHKRIAIATLAAAIVQARGNTDFASLADAVWHADWVLFPHDYIDCKEFAEWKTVPRSIGDRSDLHK